ncbi:IclR family transcriptional regulator [Salipiger sp. IMCC34102]|uniref:IclR family transcriptional regulator n=1 Tax=Salipiger sp. IMCC34102 TaxID=2510647 RepID=UPI0013EAE819|nr:IclR family transcriptional regulator [Salipiger sp. IMCC34102]
MDSTLLKGLTLLEAIVAEGHPIGISALARRVDLPKSNVHRSISALREGGYVNFDAESRRYYPSLKLAQMGRRVNAGFPFRMAILPVLRELVAATGESAHFVLLDGDSVVFVANARPDTTVASVIPDSLSLRWEDTALGVALVSALPPEDRARLLARTETPTIRDWLARTERDGIAQLPRHATRRIFELAAPVRSGWDTVIGAIGITGPSMRFDDAKLPDRISAVTSAARIAFTAHEGLSAGPDHG